MGIQAGVGQFLLPGTEEIRSLDGITFHSFKGKPCAPVLLVMHPVCSIGTDVSEELAAILPKARCEQCLSCTRSCSALTHRHAVKQVEELGLPVLPAVSHAWLFLLCQN